MSEDALATANPPQVAPRDIRCHCGSLVARMIGGKLEIKCRRCQRLGLLDIGRPLAEGETVEVEWLPDPARAKRK